MITRLGEVCTLITDGSHNPPNGTNNSDFYMLSSKNILDDEITLDEPRYLTQEQFERENKRTNISVGDVLMTIVGTVGRVAVVNENMPSICLQRSVAVLKPNKELVNNRFLMYQLQSMRDYLTNESRGVAQKGIYLKQLSQLQIVVPEKQKQEEIVCVLDKINQIITNNKIQLEKLDELIKSRFIEMFNTEKNEDKLISLCRFIDYRGKTPEKTDSGLPFITAKNVKMHYMSFDTQEYISKENYDKAMTRGFPQIGDVVFTTEAPLGNVCRIPHIDTEFYIGQRIITMQTEILEPIYLEYALSSDEFRRKLVEKSSGSTVTGIRSKLLEQLTIPVPEKSKQKEFAIFVEQTDKSKFEIQKSLEKLEILKKSLMQKYFG